MTCLLVTSLLIDIKHKIDLTWPLLRPDDLFSQISILRSVAKITTKNTYNMDKKRKETKTEKKNN